MGTVCKLLCHNMQNQPAKVQTVEGFKSVSFDFTYTLRSGSYAASCVSSWYIFLLFVKRQATNAGACSSNYPEWNLQVF